MHNWHFEIQLLYQNRNTALYGSSVYKATRITDKDFVVQTEFPRNFLLVKHKGSICFHAFAYDSHIRRSLETCAQPNNSGTYALKLPPGFKFANTEF